MKQQVRMAFENICIAQRGKVYMQLADTVDMADIDGEDPRMIIEQLILILVHYAMTHEQRLGKNPIRTVKDVIDIYHATMQHIAAASISNHVAEA